jgi:hypothetical protein
MRNILNINFDKISDDLIEKEMKRVSSEYNLRTYNMDIDYFIN